MGALIDLVAELRRREELDTPPGWSVVKVGGLWVGRRAYVPGKVAAASVDPQLDRLDVVAAIRRLEGYDAQ